MKTTNRGFIRFFVSPPTICIGLLGALACLTFASAAPAASASPTQTLTIEATTDEQPALLSTISSFEKANPSVNISAKYLADATEETLMPTELSGGTAADIVAMYPGSTSASSVVPLHSYLVNLTGQPWAKQTPPEYDESLGIAGKVYMPAIAIESVVAIYNQSELSKLHLSIPRTWSQVLSLCSAATSAGISAYAVGAATDYENQMEPFLLEATLVGGPDPNFIALREANKTSFTHSPWLNVFEQEDQMLKKGCFTKDPTGTAVTEAQAELAQGQALGYFGLSVQLPDIQALNKSDKFVVTSFPSTDNANATRFSIALGASLAINAKISPSLLPAAEKFLDYVMQPKQLAQWAEENNEAPGIADPDYTPTAFSAAQVQAQKAGKVTLVPDQFFPNPNVRTVWITENEKMLDGGASPLDIVQAMDKAW
jgi:raffinose/stachyose/melibiose transport system substrate-binding protein